MVQTPQPHQKGKDWPSLCVETAVSTTSRSVSSEGSSPSVIPSARPASAVHGVHNRIKKGWTGRRSVSKLPSRLHPGPSRQKAARQGSSRLLTQKAPLTRYTTASKRDRLRHPNLEIMNPHFPYCIRDQHGFDNERRQHVVRTIRYSSGECATFVSMSTAARRMISFLEQFKAALRSADAAN